MSSERPPSSQAFSEVGGGTANACPALGPSPAEAQQPSLRITDLVLRPARRGIGGGAPSAAQAGDLQLCAGQTLTTS